MPRIEFDIAELRGLVEAVVKETMARMEQARFWPAQLTFDEREAANLLGISRRKLQAMRLELEKGGEAVAQKFGRQVRYNRHDLLRLAGMPEET